MIKLLLPWLTFWNYSIKRQLILGISFLILMSLLLMAFNIIQKQKKFLDEESENQARSRVESLAMNATSWLLTNDFIGLQETVDTQHLYNDQIYAMIHDLSGKVLAHSDTDKVGQFLVDTISVELLKQQPRTYQNIIHHEIDDDEHFIEVAAPIIYKNELLGYARSRINHDHWSTSLHIIKHEFIITIAISMFFTLLLTYLSVKKLTDSIYNLIDVAKRVKEGENVKAFETGVEEIKMLALAFNNMLEAKERNEATLQSSLNDIYHYQKVLDDSSIVSKTNPDGIITYANENFLAISGYRLEELIGKTHSVLYHPDTPRAVIKNLWKTIKAKKTWKGILKNRKKDGTHYVVDATIEPILDIKGTVVEFISVRHDITEIYNKQQELERLALTDILTSLNNRAKLIQDLHKSTSPALAILDIDGFANINDFYGHEMGDFILKTLGENLLNYSGEQARVYRYTSDRFVLLCDTMPHDAFLEFIERIVRKSDVFEYHFNDATISIKLSVALSFEPKETIMQSADIILAELKKRNLNFLIYDRSLGIEAEIEHNMEWNKKLKTALKEDKIICYYQPILNNHTGKIEKYESLVRMIDSDGSIVSPFKFLHIAKKSKQYLSITKKVIEHSFEKFKDEECEFSINLTMEDITSVEINALLDFKLSDKRYKGRVVYEVVESEGIEKVEPVYEFIKKAKEASCKIAIDDFGTGYSNFEYLIKLSPHYIKIDGSMIKNITSNKDSEEVVRTIIDFAQKRHLKTIAEFVSSKEIYEKVIELGIDYSQGYFIGEPKAELVRL